jgi:hypothetical protein
VHRFIFILILFVGLLGCDRVDQAFETVEKVKALKTDIEKTAGQVKKDLMGKAEEIKKNTLKDVGELPYLNQQEKESSDEGKNSRRGKHDEGD